MSILCEHEYLYMDNCKFGFIYSDSGKSDVHIDEDGDVVVVWAFRASPEDALVSPDLKPDTFQHIYE